MPEGHVYILGSTTGTLYTGVTCKFDRRLFEHRNGVKSAFASRHKCNRLLLHERYVNIRSGIAREKEIKGWTRSKKLALTSKTNPEFKDLAAQHGWLMLHPNQNSEISGSPVAVVILSAAKDPETLPVPMPFSSCSPKRSCPSLKAAIQTHSVTIPASRR